MGEYEEVYRYMIDTLDIDIVPREVYDREMDIRYRRDVYDIHTYINSTSGAYMYDVYDMNGTIADDRREYEDSTVNNREIVGRCREMVDGMVECIDNTIEEERCVMDTIESMRSIEMEGVDTIDSMMQVDDALGSIESRLTDIYTSMIHHE